MSLLYSILKPIVRKVIKGSSLHQEEELTDFLRTHSFRDARIKGADYHYLLCGKGDVTGIWINQMIAYCLYTT